LQTKSARAPCFSPALNLFFNKNYPQILLESLILKCLSGEQLVGCVEIKINEDDSAYIGMLTVNPLLQNAGIGALLINCAEEKAKELGALLFRLTVIDTRQELLAWYERKGYQRTNVRTKFEFADVRFGVPRKDLYFLELIKPLPSFD
jgi:GNAT superfamily N-acetyltransferase